uniref:SAP domain-containing protein n=1 Tax=Tetradesmus obliquus TaxID=3088 RepID=A0A383WJP1_TETOB|eukprot:jgi/Sobl393_1/12013/SZX77677.1
MADEEYDPDALDAKEEEDDDSHESSKERIIALIDADQSMLATFEDDGTERSYLAWAMFLLEQQCSARIRASPNDEIGVIFYSTKQRSESDELRSFEHVWEHVALAPPDAGTIRKLRDFQEASFQDQPGCDDVAAAPGRAAEDLKNGLWACWDLLTKGGAASARVDKSLLIFTNNPDPLHDAGSAAPHLREQLHSRARELGGLAVSIEVVPLVQLSDPAAFDYGPFWRGLLQEASSAARGCEDGLAEAGQAAALQMDEAPESLLAKVDRVRGINLRIARKRPLAALTWSLAPGLKIGVQLYGMVQIAKRPAHKYITRDRADLVTSSNALVAADTGTILPSVQHKAFVPDKKLEGRFDKVMLSRAEERELRTLRPKGLTLLGFKPASCLKDSHQLGPSRFVYPDERWLKGSTAAYVALYRACTVGREEPLMAICSYVPRSGGMPSLAAMLPQRPGYETGDDGTVQLVDSPGFHMLLLPFRDDVRAPEAEQAMLKRLDGAPPRASDDQVAAAEALISALSLDIPGEPPFSSTLIDNPHLARYWQVLEDLAMGDEPRPLEDLEDDTAPEAEGIDAHDTTIDAFKLAVWGSTDGPPAQKKAAAAGTKRKAAEVDGTVAEEYAKHDWRGLAAKPGKAGLEKLTAALLKTYLKFHGLAVSGNKPELIARIQEHVAQQPQQQQV